MSTSSATSSAMPGDSMGEGGSARSPLAGQDDLLARVVRGAHETVDRLAETAAPHVHRLQEGVAQAGGKLHERSDQMREVGDEWAESLRCTVRENPLAAVAVAVTLGILVARLSA
jgi:ElaB/YqjD/DUF883 family membrane-anchored ribosome-binding protein